MSWTAPSVVQFRLDTVTTEYELGAGAVARFGEASRRAEGAALGQWVAWEQEGHADLAIAYGRTRGALMWRTPLLRGKATKRSVEVTAGAVACATMTPDEVSAAMATAAAFWGELEEAHLRRVDIAADVAGWHPSEIDLADFVIRARVAKSVSLKQYGGGATCTGFTVAPGNGIKLNVYDKLAELARPESEHKAELELAAWARGGWDGESQVTRVEVQLRTAQARELGFTPANLAAPIDPAWQYTVRKWLRVVDHSTSTRRERAKPCPAWLAVQGAQFDREAAPAERKRARPGPTPAATLGTVRALLAARGDLPDDPTPEAYAEAVALLLRAELGAKHGEALDRVLAERHLAAVAVYGEQKKKTGK